MKHWLLLFICIVGMIPASALAAPSAQVSTPHATVDLLSNKGTIKAGEPFWLGFNFKLKPGWHIYFENPGDSGLPPKVTWQANTPQTLGPLLFPTPQIIPLGKLVNYGYSNEVLFPVQASVDVPEGRNNIELKASLSWLICHEDCVPEKGEFVLTLPVADHDPAPSDANEIISKTVAALPRKPGADKRFEIKEAGDSLLIELPSGIEQQHAPYFFPAHKGFIRASAPQTVVSEADGKKYIKALKATAFKAPEHATGILQYRDSDTQMIALNLTSSPLTFATTSPTQPQSTTTTAEETSSVPFLVLIIGATVGGILLNLMPCVLPVLSLKVLSLCNQAHESRGRQLVLALTYAFGVISSLLTLATTLILLRSQGAEIGWGFQLQYPPIVGLLALFFFLIGLSFLGFFEIQSDICNKAARLDTKEGVGGAFLSGLLATIVATPCTAPFMGTAVGVALFRPWYQALLIFASLGFGIALPYVLLVVFPKLKRFLPRPGLWMITLKEFFAFPLFATSLWLLWILGVQRGGPGVILVLFSAVITVLGLWIKKSFSDGEKSAIWKTVAFALMILGVAIIPLPDMLAVQRGEVRLADNRVSDAHGLIWEPFSTALINDIRQSGELAYIDFTAAWCITCQVNKTLVFSDTRVQDFLKKNKVRLVRGDWTNQDPEVTRTLASFGRASVPFNLIYGRTTANAPFVLPTVLTPQTVLDYLEKAVK